MQENLRTYSYSSSIAWFKNPVSDGFGRRERKKEI
jgi:hypothetical protein